MITILTLSFLAVAVLVGLWTLLRRDLETRAAEHHARTTAQVRKTVAEAMPAQGRLSRRASRKRAALRKRLGGSAELQVLGETVAIGFATVSIGACLFIDSEHLAVGWGLVLLGCALGSAAWAWSRT